MAEALIEAIASSNIQLIVCIMFFFIIQLGKLVSANI